MISYLTDLKMGLAAMMALPLGPILMWLDRNGLLPDGSIVLGVAVLVLIDTIVGIWASVKKGRKISSHRAKGVVKKMVLYLVLIEAVTITMHHMGDNQIKDYLFSVATTALMIRELISITENVSIIHPSLVPAWVRRKLADIDDDGKLNNSTKDNA